MNLYIDRLTSFFEPKNQKPARFGRPPSKAKNPSPASPASPAEPVVTEMIHPVGRLGLFPLPLLDYVKSLFEGVFVRQRGRVAPHRCVDA